MLGNFARPLKDIILVIQMHKIIFITVTLLNKAFLRYFLHIFGFDTFLFSSISWKPFNWLTSFFTDILDIAQRVTSLKKSFQFSLFESCSASYLMKFCTFVLFITLTVNVLRKICSMYPSTRDLLTYFGYILQCLDKLKTFLWYFSQISWYYCDGH